MATKASMSSIGQPLDRSHEDIIYQRLEDISKKIHHEPPPLQFHPSTVSPRQQLHFEKSLKLNGSPMTKSSLQMQVEINSSSFKMTN